jgi:PAS domain S-box-containing protein
MNPDSGSKRQSAAQVPEASLPRLFAQIFATAADAMLVVDASGRIVLANAQCEQMFGYSADQLNGMTVDQLVPARLRTAHRQHRHSYAGHAVPRPMGINTTLSALHADGTEIPVEISLSPLELDGLQLTCANIRNVSELRRAQEAIERANRAEAVAEFGRLTLGTQTVSDKVRFACQLIREHLNCDAVLIARCGATPGQLALDPGCDDDGNRLAPLLPLIGEQMATLSLEHAEPVLLIEDPAQISPNFASALRHAGLRSAMICTIPDASNRSGLIGAFGQAGDTFTNEDRSFLRALANTLGALRQRQSAEEQLFQSQRLEALGQLTGGVAHDFNNLLTVVSGNLQILEERSPDDPTAAAMIRSALRAAGRGADLTRKLLAFARRQTLQPRAIDVAAWLESLAEILRRTLGPNIDIETRCSPDMPAVHADPVMLDTALLNLAVNARDAMPAGGRLSLIAEFFHHGGAEMTRRRDLAPGHYMLLTVSDSGSGMSAEVLARAFEPFFTTKETSKGSGLGLSLVYGFVKQSGGHVEVESSPDAGTVIRMMLPTVSSAENAPTPAPHDVAEGGTERVLVVEDDDDVRTVAVGFLRRLGYQVIEAAEGPQALARIAADSVIDLLFTDVVLRGPMTGADLAREALAQRPTLAVLFTSGYAPQTLSLDTALSRGVELLGKPYRIEQLARMVRRAIEARDQAAASSRRASLRPTTARRRSIS